MHVGSHARNAGTEAVRVAWSLEKALMAHVATKKDLEAGDLMVSPAVVAQQWTTVHEVRSMMLTRASSPAARERESTAQP